ncbi:MAG: hypothetical protein K6T30_02400 [Alicyclobacillus sp.]|nr:hypothetical protein [Alicyclobacillus sp.]
MAAIVNLGAVQFGGSSNGVGVFNGQNMQNAWDANSPNISVAGTMYGQAELAWNVWLVMNNWMPVGQPVLDNDIKDNASPQLEGP